MVGTSSQGVCGKKYRTSLSRVLSRKVRGCIFVEHCGSLCGEIWKGTVWSNHGSLFTHGHSTQGKTERPNSVTKKTSLRNPKSHGSYPQFSPYIVRKRQTGHTSFNLFWQPVATGRGKYCHVLGCKELPSPAHTRLISKLWIL